MSRPTMDELVARMYRRQGLKEDPIVGFYYTLRELAADRHAWVIPLTFGRARIVVGRPGDDGILDGW